MFVSLRSRFAAVPAILGVLIAFGVISLVCAERSEPADAYTMEISPESICAEAERTAEDVAMSMALSPANGTSVPAGEPVTFSGRSTHVLTFDIASSEALLSSPDVDSGLGSQSGALYEFTSTKATVVPRTIYWTASFTETPEKCESPSTFTTSVHTLIVTESEAELAAAKQQEEAATKKKSEQEVAKAKREAEEATKKEEEAAAAGTVKLDDNLIGVTLRRFASIKLTCSDIEMCRGELALYVPGSLKKKGKARHTIGLARFSIAAGKTETIEFTLDKRATELLRTARGGLRATLAIRRTSPLPAKAQIEDVRLDQAKKQARTPSSPFARSSDV